LIIMDLANQQKKLSLQPSNRQTVVYAGKEKSVLAAFLLAFIFGPIGLFYASIRSGIIMTLISLANVVLIVLSGFNLFLEILAVIIWIICIVKAYNAAKATIKDMDRRIKFRNNESVLYKSFIIFLAFVITLPLIIVLLYIIKQGVLQVNWHFLTHVPAPEGETGGGIANALVGSLIIVAMSSVVAIPIGILAGIYLSENPGTKLAYYSGLCVDILQGVPSIVVGIIIYFWIVKPFGFSAVSGSIALAIMMMPIVIRSTEQTLLLLPPSLKEAALSLGVPYHRVILKVIVPCGFAGILSGIILSIARIIGETAPLLFTALGNNYLSANIAKPMESLPHMIYTYATSPYDDQHDLAWGASFILLMFVLLLNIFTKLITRKWNIQL